MFERRLDLVELANMINLQEDHVMVELGSAMGCSANTFATMVKTLYCVDKWDVGCEIQDELVFDKVVELHPNIIKIKGYTDKEYTRFPDRSLDFVYIDADHYYSSVMKDILYWLPKIKIGGYIGGHDCVYKDPRDFWNRQDTGNVYEVLRDIFDYDTDNDMLISTNWYKKVDLSDKYIQKILGPHYIQEHERV